MKETRAVKSSPNSQNKISKPSGKHTSDLLLRTFLSRGRRASPYLQGSLGNYYLSPQLKATSPHLSLTDLAQGHQLIREGL